MNVPTSGECFSQLIEYLRKAQEASAMLSHLAKANNEDMRSLGWMTVSEALKLMQHRVTELATKRLQ